MHKDISVDYITSVMFHTEEYIPEHSTTEIIVKINGASEDKSYIIGAQVIVEDALIRMLELSVKEQKPKGFHRRDLGLNPLCFSNDNLQRRKLNNLEKTQLFAETRVISVLNKRNLAQR